MDLSGQLQALAALPPEKDPPVPHNRTLCGLQSQSGLSGDEEMNVSMPTIEPLIV